MPFLLSWVQTDCDELDEHHKITYKVKRSDKMQFFMPDDTNLAIKYWGFLGKFEWCCVTTVYSSTEIPLTLLTPEHPEHIHNVS